MSTKRTATNNAVAFDSEQPPEASFGTLRSKQKTDSTSAVSDAAATHPITNEFKSKHVRLVPWGPWAAVVYAVLVYFMAQIAASVLIIIYPHLRGWDKARATSWLNGTVTAQFWYVLFAEALTFAAIWWFIRARKGSLRSIGWRWPRWTDPVYTLAGFLVYIVAYVVVLHTATTLVPSINVDQKQDLGFSGPSGTLALTLTFLSLVVMPPIVEETVFRGFIFTGLRGKLKPVMAALLTSAIFASAHLQFGSGQPLLWVAALDTFTLSLVLCYLREKTDSLWPGILLHALKNFIAFTSLYLIAK